jgi:hypothetical protein
MGRRVTTLVLLIFFILAVYTYLGVLEIRQDIDSQIESHAILKETGESSPYNMAFDLLQNHTYKITVQFYDYSEGIARVNGTVQIAIDGFTVLDTTLYDYSVASEEGGTSARAEATYSLHPDTNVSVLVSGVFYRGDDWTLTVYRDLPIDLEYRQSFAHAATIASLLLLVGVLSACLVILAIQLPDWGKSSDDDYYELLEEIYSE